MHESEVSYKIILDRYISTLAPFYVTEMQYLVLVLVLDDCGT